MTTPPTLSAAVIKSGRLVVRKARDTDREGIVEVLTDPEVRVYLGGPRRREDVERLLDQAGTADTAAAAGGYVIADRQADQFAGMPELSRRPVGRPGHVTGEGGELELSYVLRRGAWGAGLAFEAAMAALCAAAGELPDQPVLVVTRTANHRARRLVGQLGLRKPAPSRSTTRSRLSPWPGWARSGPRDRRARANPRGVSPRMSWADRRPQISGRAA
jgi:RimJ/RimL family protein N-acetyltransferase